MCRPPLVAGLHSGDLDRIATLTSAGRLVAVRIDGDSVIVGVIGREQADPDRVVNQVRTAVTVCAPIAYITVSILGSLNPDNDTF